MEWFWYIIIGVLSAAAGLSLYRFYINRIKLRRLCVMLALVDTIFIAIALAMLIRWIM